MSNKGKNNPNYKHGKYIKGIHYCIESDCNNIVCWKGNRCNFCANKGKRNPMFSKKRNLKDNKNPMFNVHRFGENAPMFNKKHTEKTKEKMKQNHWSKTHPERFKKFIKNQRPNNLTIYENKLASILQKENINFIRQYKVGTYCCDFYLPKFNLIIEIDGYPKLQKRKNFIKSKKFKLLHIKNRELININNILKKIYVK